MKAYCIVYERLHNPQMFEEYRKQVMPTIEAFGGKFLVRGGKFTALEGDMPFEIKVKLNPPKGLPPLRVYAKTGYYAPTK